MHNKTINLALVAQVAEGLKELREKMIFIGGAVISLYTDDPAAEEIRPDPRSVPRELLGKVSRL